MRQLATRIANLVSRAIVRRVDDAKKMQSLQVDLLDTETRDEVERPQNYGFTSVPLEGAEAVAVFVGGRRDHGLVLAVEDRRYRVTGLKSGEVAIYTDEGDRVTLKRGGTIEIKASSKVVVNAPAVEVAGSTNSVPKGESLNAAVAALGTSISTALTAMGAAGPAAPIVGAAAATAGTAIATAVTTFQTAAATALSTKVKIS